MAFSVVCLDSSCLYLLDQSQGWKEKTFSEGSHAIQALLHVSLECDSVYELYIALRVI